MNDKTELERLKAAADVADATYKKARDVAEAAYAEWIAAAGAAWDAWKVAKAKEDQS